MTTVRSPRLLACAQEVDPAPNPSSAQRSLRLPDRLGPADHCPAREPRGDDDLAMPQAHALGRRCRERMIWRASVSSSRKAGRRDASFSASGEPLRGPFLIESLFEKGKPAQAEFF